MKPERVRKEAKPKDESHKNQKELRKKQNQRIKTKYEAPKTSN